MAGSAAAKPHAAEEGAVQFKCRKGDREQAWKDTMFYRHVNRLWWIKISFWLHGPIVIMGTVLSFLFCKSFAVPDRVVPSLLITVATWLLSLPLLQLFRLSECLREYTWKSLARYMVIASYVLAAVYGTVTISTISTLQDLKQIPRNDSHVIYADRSNECMFLFFQSLISLVCILSFVNVCCGLRKIGVTTKFLSDIKWNGHFGHPKYEKSKPLKDAWADLREHEADEWWECGHSAQIYALLIGVASAFSIIFTAFMCELEELYGIFTLDTLILVSIISLAIFFLVRSDIDNDKLSNSFVLAALTAILAMRLAYSNVSDLEKFFSLIPVVRGNLKNWWFYPRYPFVTPTSKFYDWMEVEPRLNETGEAARLAMNLLWLLARLTGLLHMARVFNRCSTLNMNRQLDPSPIPMILLGFNSIMKSKM